MAKHRRRRAGRAAQTLKPNPSMDVHPPILSKQYARSSVDCGWISLAFLRRARALRKQRVAMVRKKV
jgi:hypothetical protein